MTVLIADRDHIRLPQDALVEVRGPGGEHIGYYKLELPPAGHGPAAEPPAAPDAPPAAG